MDITNPLTQEMLIYQSAIIVLGFAVIWFFTDWIIKRVLFQGKTIIDVDKDGKETNLDKQIIDSGRLIGKCENLIIYIMVLMDQYTGLAIIFTAKNLARQSEVQENPNYYLVGTLLNFSASFLISVIIRQVLSFIP